ncbi:beta-glucosidase [Robiginitalea myxolifaciens]|uniref:beta-N-acetylhexosaminidase n=1 Tax=Robiginitalea myxolifaciens TaxID=400055 RepID=A0A1I6FNC2_9FLAO|nr:glycoside hydrolase family 3 protein [Robiginitalea myxolifaciens]SFR31388.1 beta-glucosidase [Robiginitalea myxolifaciens]
MPTSIQAYEDVVDSLPLTQKIGQLLMPAAFVNDSEDEIQRLESQIRELGIGGICFFHSRASAATNFEGEKEVPVNPDSLGRLKELIARYQKASAIPLLIAIDAEWGLAMRLENGEAYPYALCLGALPPGHELVRRTGFRMGLDCKAAGIHWNLAPVADVNLNPANPVIGYRSFGADHHHVAQHAVSLYRGMQQAEILGCAKHFPGHGDTATDSHLELPVLDKSADSLDAIELLPFRSLISAGIEGVMPGHLTVPSLDPTGLPATLSPTMIRDVLRGKLGFRGVVVSDALNMHAVSKRYAAPGELAAVALNAGNDILCFVEDLEQSVAAIADKVSHGDKNSITAQRLEDSFARVWKLKERVFQSDTTTSSPNSNEPKLKPESPGALRKALAAATLTAVKTRTTERDTTRRAWILAGEDLGPFESELGAGHLGNSMRISWDKQGILSQDSRWPLPDESEVVLVLAPPKLKPAGNFGLPKSFTDFLVTLCEQRNVSLCLLGNPYVLNLPGCAQAAEILLAYSPLAEFQKQAARYYLGKVEAPGNLPVKIPGH